MAIGQFLIDIRTKTGLFPVFYASNFEFKEK